MNEEQRRNLLSAADAIGDHLAHAWNYTATIRALQRHAQHCPEVFAKHAHFIATVTYAIWDALFLKLSHCADKRREAFGFPKFFKQIRKYLEPHDDVVQSMEQYEGELNALHVREKAAKWRNHVVAHYTLKGDDVAFYEDNVCKIDEIENLVSTYQRILNFYSLKLLDMNFMVKDLGPKAQDGVDRLVGGLCTEQLGGADRQ